MFTTEARNQTQGGKKHTLTEQQYVIHQEVEKSLVYFTDTNLPYEGAVEQQLQRPFVLKLVIYLFDVWCMGLS